MNITFEKIDDVNGKIVAQVEEADYASKVDAELRKIGNTHNIPGFRKGHISLPQLRQRFGKQVKSDVLNRSVYEAVVDYIKEQKLNIIGQPIAEEIKEINLTDKDYTFTYEVGIAPAIDLKLDKEVTLPYKAIEVTDQMVADEDKSLRERFGAQVPGEEVEANSLVKGSIMELDEAGNVKTSDDAIQMINGIVAPMYFKDKAEADKFIGKKVNDKVVFNPWKTCEGNAAELSSMLGVDKSKAADIKGDFELSISEIIVLRPAELGQELYDNVLGKDKATTEEEYRNALKDMIARELSRNSEMLFRVDTEKAMMEKYGDMELPVEILKKWLIRRNDELNDANIDEEYAKMEQGLKWQLIKERIGEICQIKIEEQDLIGHAKMIASMQFAQYGMTNMDDDTLTDYAKRILADKNYRPRIVEEVGDIKLFAAVKEAVTINAENVTLDKFKEIATKQ